MRNGNTQIQIMLSIEGVHFSIVFRIYRAIIAHLSPN